MGSKINTDNSDLWMCDQEIVCLLHDILGVKTLLSLPGPQKQQSPSANDNPWLIPDYTSRQ